MSTFREVQPDFSQTGWSRRAVLRAVISAAGTSSLTGFGLQPAYAQETTSDPGVAAAEKTLPRTLAAITAGMGTQQVGAQAYVSIGGKPVASFALGLARPGVALTTETMFIWYSATKPTFAILIAQLCDQGLIRLDDRIVDYIPQFAQNGKDEVTIRQCLTHSAGIPHAGSISPVQGLTPEEIASISAASLEFPPGQFKEYHPFSTGFILGEIIQRITGRPYQDHIRKALFLPLRMPDCWVGMTQERFDAYGDKIGLLYSENRSGELVPPQDGEKFSLNVTPSANGRGPMKQFARFYEALLAGGELDGVQILSEQMTEKFTTYYSLLPEWDKTQEEPTPAGLGFVRRETRLFGVHASLQVFGSVGSASSVAFCDPRHDLVVAYVLNGRIQDYVAHRDRCAAISGAIYQDLGIA
ncbi:MAG: beta-lactamase family protein [Nevskiales bacterium]|nr:beta-lactamase family protein [Nevskiales bacterium]